MTRLPRIKGTELIKILKKLGFNIIRVKGSHHFLQHADGRCTVVPVHSGETIGPGLLIKILNDCEISKEKLIKFL